jgi:hypothetical protein
MIQKYWIPPYQACPRGGGDTGQAYQVRNDNEELDPGSSPG